MERDEYEQLEDALYRRIAPANEAALRLSQQLSDLRLDDPDRAELDRQYWHASGRSEGLHQAWELLKEYRPKR